MTIHKVSAFSFNNQGGNPAGVLLLDQLPIESEMLSIAKKVGYSETAFLKPMEDGWRIRYFAPDMEVPFCGHATIASGAVLGEQVGTGDYKLYLNEGSINISVINEESNFIVSLQSPQTYSEPAPLEYVRELISTFNFSLNDIDIANYPIRFASAGAKHLILFVKEHNTLKQMEYDFDTLKQAMKKEGLVTVNLLWPESNQLIHSRNPFPPGGVYEDPATGAAAAALAGYLRDINWKGEQKFEVRQGTEMGCPSRLQVEYSQEIGSSIKISGDTRKIIV
ncbi:MAG: PhzF family phenazine biosynthesis protein [Cellvibrionaceae bacterium]